MPQKKFQRRIEDFVCEHCGAHVKGTGYTNHCPKCLWSKHVDVFPGDRSDECGGMMEPLYLEGTTEKYRIVHRCDRCGAERRVSVSADDDMDAVTRLAGNH